MNDNYILIETRLFENGWTRIKRKLNASGEWDEQTFSTDITKKPETEETPASYKNTTIIDYQDKGCSHKFKYDAYGRVVKMKYYTNHILTSYSEFKYNSPYTKIWCDQFIMYKTPRKMEYIFKFKYNSKGDKIQESCYYPNRDLAWYADWKYNNEGQLTEVLTYNNKDILIYKKITSYHNGEKVKKEKFIHKDYFHKWQPNNGGQLDFCLDTTI